MKFTSNRPLWLLCASVVQDSCKKPKWHHHSRYQMEELWIWAVGFKWRHRNPSRVHLMTTPLGNQLSFRTFCWLQIALLFPYYWRVGSLLLPPPALPTIHENLSVPLPDTLHLAKLILWAHNVHSGNARCIYWRYICLDWTIRMQDAYPTLQYI